MNSILEPLFKLLDNPLTQFFQSIGVSIGIAKALSASIGALFLGLVALGFKKLKQLYKDTRTARERVHFRFGYKDVRNKRKYYIPTRAQNISPAYEEEPLDGISSIVKMPLIPHFINTAFDEKKESEKFYLILGDSGMGKTTFMINLYWQYHSVFNFRRKYKMKLFPFGDKDILKWLKEIPTNEARDTILLLDAFDEYKALLPPEKSDGLTDDERFQKVLDEVVENVKDFREVVITSRTQYFPGQEKEPYVLKIPRFGRAGFHTLVKLYLSPFEKKEIESFLDKKYGVLRYWNRQKKQKAAGVVAKSPKLMVRPMLLSYIDLLMDHPTKFEKTYEIYQTLVNKWIEREADKRKSEFEDHKQFKKDLLAFSRLAALEIYQNPAQNHLISREDAEAICRKNNINLQGYEITGQSLLTRDASQNWKFAHKSIMEYFLALECFENMKFAFNFEFTGMDMTKRFYREFLPVFNALDFMTIPGGTFLMGSPKNETNRSEDETQHSVKVSGFFLAKYPVTQKQWQEIMGNNPSRFSSGDDYPVESVSWDNVQQFIEKLNRQTGQKFRLPTEAEWEYACRAGTTTPFNTGENLTTDQANYDGNYPYKDFPKGKYLKRTTPVGSYPPNAWGLYDMHGNVYEWCQDRYDKNYYEACKDTGVVENPTGPETGSARVLRGGSWDNGARNCRSASRGRNDPAYRGDAVGFRLVFVP